MYINKFRGANVLITGHTGFKGSWLSLWLKQLGAKVHGISLGEVSTPSNFSALGLENNINHHVFDIRDYELLNKRVKSIQPDFVFHLAAQALVKDSYNDPLQTFSTNAIGTAHVLESLRDYDKDCVLVLITSDKCYENKEWIWGYRETDRLGGKDPYSASKAAAENIIHAYLSSFFSDSKVKIGIGRAGNVIGGGDWANNRIVPDCIKAWSNNEKVEIRNPESTRPWQHVLEPLSGYLSLASNLYENNSLHGEAFNFGPASNQNHTVKQLLNAMGQHWSQAEWKDVSNDAEKQYEAGLLKLDCDKALQLLDWKPSLVFEDTVKFTIDWYKKYYNDTSLNMSEFTINQIEKYTQLAKENNISWAI